MATIKLDGFKIVVRPDLVAEADLEDEEIEVGLIVARDKDWLIMPPDRPGKFLITQAGFDAALAGA